MVGRVAEAGWYPVVGHDADHLEQLVAALAVAPHLPLGLPVVLSHSHGQPGPVVAHLYPRHIQPQDLAPQHPVLHHAFGPHLLEDPPQGLGPGVEGRLWRQRLGLGRAEGGALDGMDLHPAVEQGRPPGQAWGRAGSEQVQCGGVAGVPGCPGQAGPQRALRLVFGQHPGGGALHQAGTAGEEAVPGTFHDIAPVGADQGLELGLEE